MDSEKNIDLHFFSVMKINFYRFLPRLFKLCKKDTTKERIFMDSFHKLNREIDIIRLLKQIRVMKAAIQAQTTKADWLRFKQTASVKSIWFEQGKE